MAIPANAGTQGLLACAGMRVAQPVDSRFRGNDGAARKSQWGPGMTVGAGTTVEEGIKTLRRDCLGNLPHYPLSRRGENLPDVF